MTASAELFPSSAMASLSPRLLWHARHNLAVGQLPDGVKFCVSRQWVGYGDTMLEAEEEWAAGEHIKHWQQEEFEKAGVVVPEASSEIESGD